MNRDRIFGATVLVALVATVALAVALGVDLAKKDQQALPVRAGSPSSGSRLGIAVRAVANSQRYSMLLGI
jgi:hypothetical protein